MVSFIVVKSWLILCIQSSPLPIDTFYIFDQEFYAQKGEISKIDIVMAVMSFPVLNADEMIAL